MAQGGSADMKNLPKRSERKDYRAMHEGFQFGDDGEDMSFRASAGNTVKPPQDTEDIYDDDQDWDNRENARKAAEELQRMRAEFDDLEEEESLLRRQRAEADDLRQRLAKKREVVSKLRGEIIPIYENGGKDANAKSAKAKSAKAKSTKSAKSARQVKKEIDTLTISDLRKDKKLRKKVQSNINKLGLDIFGSGSSESEVSGSEEDSSSGSGSDSEDESDSEAEKTKKKKSKSKKSGITAKASDKVKKTEKYPQAYLRFEYVNDAVSFENLNVNLFVAGELEIISSSSVKEQEKTARIQLLKKLMYLNSSHDFSVLRSLYAAVLREVETGRLKWGDSFQYVENSVLEKQRVKKTDAWKGKNVVKGKNEKIDSETVWFCSLFQRNKCAHKAPHTMVVKGVMRLAQHICAACWMKDKLKLEHPECSSACPHARD